MKRISLYPNEKRDPDLEFTRQVIRLLEEDGVRFFVEDRYFAYLASVSSEIDFVSYEELFCLGEVVVVLGGDGTMLSVARSAAEYGVPLCGINLGNVGFITSLEKKEIGKIRRLLTDRITFSERMTVSCRINGAEALLALNECVIAPEKGFHIVEMDLFAGEKKLCDFRADGVIFHTPTGSTGYSFSAGGAVCDGEFDLLGVKAISSYLLRGAHHMIFSPDTVFSVKNCRSEGCPVTVCADGREAVELCEGDEVVFCRSEKRVKLVEFSKTGNHEIFFRKF
jgi:NAD+ kinase